MSLFFDEESIWRQNADHERNKTKSTIGETSFILWQNKLHGNDLLSLSPLPLLFLSYQLKARRKKKRHKTGSRQLSSTLITIHHTAGESREFAEKVRCGVCPLRALYRPPFPTVSRNKSAPSPLSSPPFVFTKVPVQTSRYRRCSSRAPAAAARSSVHGRSAFSCTRTHPRPRPRCIPRRPRESSPDWCPSGQAQPRRRQERGGTSPEPRVKDEGNNRRRSPLCGGGRTQPIIISRSTEPQRRKLAPVSPGRAFCLREQKQRRQEEQPQFPVL